MAKGASVRDRINSLVFVGSGMFLTPQPVTWLPVPRAEVALDDL